MHANVLYIDQPIGTGFSYGSNTVNSTEDCAPYVWTLLQEFYTAFPEYQGRDFGLFTESYGGHTGPVLAKHFLDRNAAIAAGSEQGHEIHLTTLGLSNAWFDASIQEPANIEFANDNPYRQLINDSLCEALEVTY